MLNNLDEAILNISKTRSNTHGDASKNNLLYSRWETRYAHTIDDFCNDFIFPRLPKPEWILKWHKMLLEYSKMDGAIFPIRDGHTDSKDASKIKLRRGWLVRVDDHVDYAGKFSYVFTDNYFAAYIYKMALDEYCPTAKEFFEYMTTFKSPADIAWLNGRKVENPIYNTEKRHFIMMPIRFGQVGKSSYPGNTETLKNAFINTSPAPTCPFGDYGYKHAHIFAVKGIYDIGGVDVKWEDIDLVELGEESTLQQDYQWNDSIKNFVWDRKMASSHDRDALRTAVVAHFLRFLDPMNHFLAPMQGCNKFTRANGEFSLDIAEYDNLISYLMFTRKNSPDSDFSDGFNEFIDNVLPGKNLTPLNCDTEEIDIIYHEGNQDAASRKTMTAKKATRTSSSKSPTTRSATGKKDDSTYLFEGVKYKKRTLVLAVIKSHVKKHGITTFAELQRDFPDHLLGGTKGVVKRSIDISDTDKGIGGTTPRYFVKSGQTLILSGEEVMVNNQWTLTLIDSFIKHSATFGHVITKV